VEKNWWGSVSQDILLVLPFSFWQQPSIDSLQGVLLLLSLAALPGAAAHNTRKPTARMAASESDLMVLVLLTTVDFLL
jgi:hypothetical protein